MSRKKKDDSGVIENVTFSGSVPIASPAIQKMRKVAALSNACSNEKLLNTFLSMVEGAYLLEVFAAAVDKELQNIYAPTPPDTSPVQAELDSLLAKAQEIKAVVGSITPSASHYAQQPYVPQPHSGSSAGAGHPPTQQTFIPNTNSNLSFNDQLDFT